MPTLMGSHVDLLVHHLDCCNPQTMTRCGYGAVGMMPSLWCRRYGAIDMVLSVLDRRYGAIGHGGVGTYGAVGMVLSVWCFLHVMEERNSALDCMTFSVSSTGDTV